MIKITDEGNKKLAEIKEGLTESKIKMRKLTEKLKKVAEEAKPTYAGKNWDKKEVISKLVETERHISSFIDGLESIGLSCASNEFALDNALTANMEAIGMCLGLIEEGMEWFKEFFYSERPTADEIIEWHKAYCEETAKLLTEVTE